MAKGNEMSNVIHTSSHAYRKSTCGTAQIRSVKYILFHTIEPLCRADQKHRKAGNSDVRYKSNN